MDCQVTAVASADIDTPGAYPGIGAEKRGQSVAIARNIQEMSQLGVPVICTVIVEGGSGGAHRDHRWAANLLRRGLAGLSVLASDELVRQREDKFRNMGRFTGTPAKA